ncbi:UNVERIFIED_CONTAM: hypothetical protein PYX00_002723 [Menopon gallinae]|uniref:methenyltetrahydrofolate cyclohydrolase n=1 Tax=Menopon gallinae TaxID=328185 RepID=A0AAW2HYB3_9NEOP
MGGLTGISEKMAIDLSRKFFCSLNITRHCRLFSTSNLRLTAKIIDGKQIALDIQKELKEDTDKWVAEGNKRPSLIAFLVGDDPASSTYVSNKMRAAKNIGIDSKTEKLPGTLSQDELLKILHERNNDDSVDGIIVQLPLPKHMDERLICSKVYPDKDVDGFHVINVGHLVLGQETLAPCTPMGVLELIKRSGIETFGKNAVVCGRSKNVGLPIALMLHADGKENAYSMDSTTTICHRYTPREQLKHFASTADILVTATGVPNLITADMVKPGACIIDVGITRVKDPETGKTKLVGDVDYDNVSKIAGHITPVPGGVGPMTVTMLMKNTVLACKYRAQRKKENAQ